MFKYETTVELKALITKFQNDIIWCFASRIFRVVIGLHAGLEVGMAIVYVGQKMFGFVGGRIKPRYYDAEVTKVGRKYFEVKVIGHHVSRFEIDRKIGERWCDGDFDLWPSKKAFTDAMYKQLLIAEITANSKMAKTEQLECFAKEIGLNVSYPNIDL